MGGMIKEPRKKEVYVDELGHHHDTYEKACAKNQDIALERTLSNLGSFNDDLRGTPINTWIYTTQRGNVVHLKELLTQYLELTDDKKAIQPKS